MRRVACSLDFDISYAYSEISPPTTFLNAANMSLPICLAPNAVFSHHSKHFFSVPPRHLIGSYYYHCTTVLPCRPHCLIGKCCKIVKRSDRLPNTLSCPYARLIGSVTIIATSPMMHGCSRRNLYGHRYVIRENARHILRHGSQEHHC
jgi:hypothetical protein